MFTRYPCLPPKRVKRKCPIGTSGMAGTTVLRGGRFERRRFLACVDLAAEDEGDVGQTAEAGDRVGRVRSVALPAAGFRARRRRSPGARRNVPFPVLGFRADVAEVALVDLEGFRQGHGDRFDVGVTRAVVRLNSRPGSLQRAVDFRPPSWGSSSAVRTAARSS